MNNNILYSNQDGGSKELIKINDNMKLIKILGTGMFGTTYQIKYQGLKYAIKIQHILEKDQYVDFKNVIWRELDVYKYINRLSSEDQLFFTKLHDYKIYDNCTHIQERKFKFNSKNEFDKQLVELDKSSYCIKYLLDYKGKINLNNFLLKHKLNPPLIYSICLQICKIIIILYKRGYSHNDLHPGNIMINKTYRTYFNFIGEKIPYKGYQLSSIDYGNVLNKKFNIKYKHWYKGFLVDPVKWLFSEIFNSTINVIDNINLYINDCNKKKKRLPFDREVNYYDIGIKKIINNHPDFYIMVRDKYVKLFPKGKKLLDYVISKIHLNKPIYKIIKNKKHEQDFWNILDRIQIEFRVIFPKEHSKYFKWCSYHNSILPKDVMQYILVIDNTTDYINYLKNKLIVYI